MPHHGPAFSARLARALPLAASALALVMGLSGCGVGQVMRGAAQATMTEEDVQAEGRNFHQKVVAEKLIYGDDRIGNYVNRVGARVAQAAQSRQGGANAQLIFRFFVIDDPDANAFAVSGGYVYVTRGLLALLNSEDELAAVLGHEIAHITDGHTLKANKAEARANMLGGLGTVGLTVLSVITFNPLLMGLASAGDTATAIGSGVLSQNYSREMELTADRIGRGYTTLAGYDSMASAKVLLSFQQEAQWGEVRARARGVKPQPVWGVFASHPENKTRQDALASQPNIPGLRRAPEGDYLGQLDGLVFGISDRIGVHRGNAFYSKAHGLALSVPVGWFVSQSTDDQTVVFFNEKNTARIGLAVQDLSTRQDAAGFAKLFFKDAKIAGALRRNGVLTVWRGTVTTSGFGGGRVYQAMTWTQGERGFALLGSRDGNSPLPETAWQQVYERVATSFRPLKAEEVALAESIKVRLAVSEKRKPLSYKALALNAPLGPEAEDVLRVINGQYGGKAEPPPGARLKVLR